MQTQIPDDYFDISILPTRPKFIELEKCNEWRDFVKTVNTDIIVGGYDWPGNSYVFRPLVADASASAEVSSSMRFVIFYFGAFENSWMACKMTCTYTTNFSATSAIGERNIDYLPKVFLPFAVVAATLCDGIPFNFCPNQAGNFNLTLKSKTEEHRYHSWFVQPKLDQIECKAGRNFIEQGVVQCGSMIRDCLKSSSPAYQPHGGTYNVIKIDPPMLAQEIKFPENVAGVAQLQYPVFIQPKLDGHRAISNFNAETGVYELYSRQTMKIAYGNVFAKDIEFMINTIKLEISRTFGCSSEADFMLPDRQFRLDGELYIHNDAKLHAITSAITMFAKNPGLNPLHWRLEYHVFSFSGTRLNYCQRQNVLKQAFEQYRAHSTEFRPSSGDLVQFWSPERLKLVESVQAGSADEIIYLFNSAKPLNYEGIMIYNNALYDYTRSSNLWKLKYSRTDEFPIVGIISARGKEAGQADFIINHNGLNVEIRPCLTAQQRIYIMNNQQQFINELIKIRYFEITSDTKGKNTGGAMRNPTMLGFVRSEFFGV